MFFFITLHSITGHAYQDNPHDLFDKSAELYQTWLLTELEDATDVNSAATWGRQGFSVRNAPSGAGSFRKPKRGAPIRTGFNYWSQTSLAERQFQSEMARLAVSAEDDLAKARLLKFIAVSEQSQTASATSNNIGSGGASSSAIGPEDSSTTSASRASVLAQWADNRLRSVQANRNLRINYELCTQLFYTSLKLEESTGPRSQSVNADGTISIGGTKDDKADKPSVNAALKKVVDLLRTQLSEHAPEVASELAKASVKRQAQILCLKSELSKLAGAGSAPPRGSEGAPPSEPMP